MSDLHSPFFSPTEDESIPALKYDKDAAVLDGSRPIFEAVYKIFYQNLSNYLLKIPTSPAKTAVQELLERNLIVLSQSISGKSGVTGVFSATSGGKLQAIALDISELNIDPRSGETPNIDNCFYASYLHYVRSAMALNALQVKKDEDLHDLVTKYYYYLMLRLLGKNVVLNEKQKLFLELVTTYFYYRFFIGQPHPLALESTIKDQSKEVIIETKDIFER